MAPQSKHSLREKVSDFSELVMFRHSVFSLPFIFIAMVVASHTVYGSGWFGWRLFFLGLAAAVSARNFAMGVNRYLDRDVDALNPRTRSRPSVDGRVSSGHMVVFILANATIFITVTYAINTLAFALAIPILIVLGAYTFFKRFSPAAHLVLGISLGLAPIAGVVAIENTITLWSVFLAAGVMFWVAGFDLLYSLQDMEFDIQHGLHSIPSRFGAATTMRMAKLFHIGTVLLWGVFVYQAQLGIWAGVAVISGAVMLAYEHYLVNKDFSKIDKAFFAVNGYLGFVFLLLIVVDVAMA